MFLKRVFLVFLIAVAAGGVYLKLHQPVLSKNTPVPAKEDFLRQSAERSSLLTRQGVEFLRQKRLGDAIERFMQAVTIFPPATEAYMMLVKTFLMTGQEQKMYEVLERAGHSYPSFDDILAVIDDADLARIPLPEQGDVFIAPFQGNKKAAVTFMFDDGEANVYTGVLPLFDKYGFKATIPVVAGQVSEKDGDPYRGSWRHWKDAVARGFEIANHSMGHRDAKQLISGDLTKEIDDAKEMIEARTGKKVRSYVFPLDSYADIVLEHVLRTHLAARKPDHLRSVYDRSMVMIYGGPKFSLKTANRLIDMAANRRLWLISESHGLDQQGAAQYKPMSVELLDRHLAYIHSRAQDLWVSTFGDVFEYLDLRSKIKVERKDVAVSQTDIIMHHGSSLRALPRPLTVVVQTSHENVSGVTARSSEGKDLNAWVCGSKSVCVDIDVCEVPVRVTWVGRQ